MFSRANQTRDGCCLLGLFLVATGYVLANLLMPFWALLRRLSSLSAAGAALAVPAANALGSLSVERTEHRDRPPPCLAAAPPAGFIFGPLIGATLL